MTITRIVGTFLHHQKDRQEGVNGLIWAVAS